MALKALHTHCVVLHVLKHLNRHDAVVRAWCLSVEGGLQEEEYRDEEDAGWCAACNEVKATDAAVLLHRLHKKQDQISV
jgi:hypothetical protein